MKKEEKEIFQEIYEKQQEFARRYLQKHFPSLNEEDQSDILQETWKTLCEHIDELREKEEEAKKAWMIVVIKNKAIDKLREQQRNQSLCERAKEEKCTLKNQQSAQDIAMNRIEASSVLKKISQRDKDILFGRYFQNKQRPQTEKNAQVCKRYRARRKLMEYMEEEID